MTAPEITIAATVDHDAVLRVYGVRSSRQRVTTLSGYGAKYRQYEGPYGMDAYLASADRNRRSYPDGPLHNRHNGVVWLSAEASVIAAKQYHAQLEAEHVQDVCIQVGDVIRVQSPCPGEAGLYRVEAPRPHALDGDSCRLIPIDA